MNNIDNKSIALDLCNKRAYGLGFDFLSLYVANKYKLHFFPFCEFIVSVQSSITERELDILRKIGRRMYEQRYPLGNLLIAIIEEKKLEEVARIFFEKEYNISKVTEWAQNVQRWPLFSDKDIAIIDKFIKLYAQYYPQQLKKISVERQKEQHKEKIALSVSIVRNFLDSKYLTVEQYCKERELKLTKVEKAIKLLVSIKHPIITEYKDRLKQVKTMDFVKKIKEMVNDITNGITLSDGKKRDFDLLDYYERIQLPLDEFLYKTNSKLSPLERKTVVSFVLKYKKDIPIGNLDIIYNMKQIVGVKFDEQGNVIPSSGREIMREEKDYIINYLKDNNIPLTNATYNTAVRRIANGALDTNEIELSDKKKNKVKTKRR